MSVNWSLKKISDICEFQNNKRVPLKSLDREKRQGEYPYYGASGIVDYIDNSLYTTNFTEPLSYQASAFLKLPKFP